tara:strand:- start:36 stop:314 length:279 start_codon:yes stop_codon:yes gene_type:complete
MKYEDILEKLEEISIGLESYNDYPDSASNNAKRAIEWKEENGSDCGTRVGWTRAGQLARKENISRDTIARIWLHLKDTSNTQMYLIARAVEG